MDDLLDFLAPHRCLTSLRDGDRWAPRARELAACRPPLGFVKVLNPRSIVVPYPAGGGHNQPALDSRVGLMFFVPGMDANLQVRGRVGNSGDAGTKSEHARVGSANRRIVVGVESASVCQSPVVLLPNSGCGFEMLADALPRFHELVRPGAGR